MRIEKQLLALKRGEELKLFKNRKKSRYMDSLRDRVKNKEVRKHGPRFKEGKLKREALIIAAQDQAIRTKFIKTMVDKSQNDPKCRICMQNNETINHIVSSCSKLAQKEYKRRHDNVARAIHWDLSGKCGFERNERWYDHVPESVLENDDYKILWDLVCEQTLKLGLGDWIW